MSRGIRVIAVINRKGGCGKSTLVRGLASAAIARGDRVTVNFAEAGKVLINAAVVELTVLADDEREQG